LRKGAAEPAAAEPTAEEVEAELSAEADEHDEEEAEDPQLAETIVQRPSGRAARSTPSGRRPSSGSRRPVQHAEAGGDEPPEGGREGSRARARNAGGQIGALQRRGMSLSAKVALFTLALTVTISVIFAIISLIDLEDKLNAEIKHSGYRQILTLHAFGQRVIERAGIKGVRNAGEFQNKLTEYTTKGLKASDLELLKRVLNDSRIKDVVIFASADASENPTTPILRGDPKANEFSAPSANLAESGMDPDVHIYNGSYGGENCLFFRMPLEKGATKGMYSSANLILAASQIKREVNSLRNRLILYGIVLVVLGVGAAFGMAGRFTRPMLSLVEDINVVSKGNLDHESTVHTQTHDEVGLLAMAFNRMTKSLRDARESERDLERIEGELDTAKKIHFNLLPEKLPQLPGIDIANDYKSAKEVGGDYYDFIPVGDLEHLALTVADVSGKGIPGSMVMGTTRTILRMMAVNNLSAADVLAKTNFHVARDIKRGMFVTCVYAILNVRTRELTVASAGHNPMLIWRSATKSIEKVRPNGIALGFDKGPVFNRTVREQKVQLYQGDRVVLYTDGVVEAMNEEREEWSDEALDEFTLKNATLPSKDYVRLLIKALTEHQGNGEQHDDITITTFRIV